MVPKTMTSAANYPTATSTSHSKHFYKSYFPLWETSRGRPGRLEDMSAGTMFGAQGIDLGFTKLRASSEQQAYKQKEELNPCWMRLMQYDNGLRWTKTRIQ